MSDDLPIYKLPARELMKQIGAKHGVSLDDILSARRQTDIAAARFEISARLYERGLSYPQIGRLINRDHTTVIHAVRRHYELEARFAALAAEMRHV